MSENEKIKIERPLFGKRDFISKIDKSWTLQYWNKYGQNSACDIFSIVRKRKEDANQKIVSNISLSGERIYIDGCVPGILDPWITFVLRKRSGVSSKHILFQKLFPYLEFED